MIIIRAYRAEYETCWFICNKNSDSTPPCIWASTNQGSIFPTFFVHVISVFRKFEVRQRSCSCCGDWLYWSRNWLPFRIPGKLSSLPIFSGVRVTRSLVLCVCFVDRCLSFCPCSFGHCVVCPYFFDLRILITTLVSKTLYVVNCCL